eukprot:GHVQ01008214.1.p1 GENE.GHVQ01008214.1~~GHVQ01008214.1.p1  ORF type:complete len:368 (-),score=44.46 GHVQ01008214.1:184-1287(-)
MSPPSPPHSASRSASELIVFGMGNPLLDIIVDAPTTLLSKYELKLDTAILAEDKHTPIYKEISQLPSALNVPGGATQNTIRICQALMRGRRCTAYCGCIGKDKNGDAMKKLLSEEGVLGLYAESDKNPTGVCGVLVNGGERSLVTSLGAANDYPLDHLRFKVWDKVEESKIIYSSGFFLTVSPEAMQTVGEHCAKTNKTYCLNLAAPFIPEFFKDPLSRVLPYADFVFGNESEFLQFGNINGYNTTNLEEIAGKMVQLPKANSRKSRVVVVTQGSDPTIVASNWMGSGVKIQKFSVELLDKSKLVDTNGAGDAFVGGFLYGLSLDKGLDYCVYAGSYAARHVIQRSGCTFDFKDIPQAMMSAASTTE